MTDKEMLEAMKTLLAPITNKLEDIDLQISELKIQMDTLRLDMKTSERSIRKEIHHINDGMDTLVEVMEAKGILPKVE